MTKNEKRSILISRIALLLVMVSALVFGTGTYGARAQEPTPTRDLSYERPLVVIQSFGSNAGEISAGQEFNLYITLVNSGQRSAQNVVATFSGTDLIPRSTGGVVAVGTIHPNNRADFTQPLTASSDLWGVSLAGVQMTLSYMSEDGVIYTENFTLTFPVRAVNYALPTATPTPTPTPTAAPNLRPQLVISSYATNVDVLQPGSQFAIQLNIQNVGNGLAKRITMIVGGGSANVSETGGTPEPGGTSGSSGEFTNFAPLNASNIQSLGELAAGGALQANQSMIVNVSTAPGAYPMRISFAYVDERGRMLVDDQVITLLVYSLPSIDIDFYMPVGEFFTGQPGMLPLQAVNIGRKSAILGNMRVSAEGADLMDNVVLIGALESGGYFPLDATLIPYTPGPLDITVTIDYNDDFNQAQQITKVITVEVIEVPVYEPPPDEGMNGEFPGGPVLASETGWQKFVRLLRGLIGLDSAPPTVSSVEMFYDEGMPFEDGFGNAPPPVKGP